MRTSNILIGLLWLSVSFCAAADDGTAALSSKQFERAHYDLELPLEGLGLVLSESFAACKGISEETFDGGGRGSVWFSDNGPMGGPAALGSFLSPATALRLGIPPTIDCDLGHLRLGLRRDGQTWHGAQIKTHSYGGHGLILPYGYWEADILLPVPPAGFVPWAAMWIRDRVTTMPVPQTFEFDVFETGMRPKDPESVDVTVHRWPARPLVPESITAHQYAQASLGVNLLDGRRHLVGLRRTKDWHIVYVDRKEQLRFPTLAADMRKPAALLLDLALMTKPTADVESYSMHVFAVRIYKEQGS